MKKKYLVKLKKIISFMYLCYWYFSFTKKFSCWRKDCSYTSYSKFKGLNGKKINYLKGKPELRLLKVKFPVGLKTPIHMHPSPILIHVTRGRLKHVKGEEIKFFKAGDAFIENNNGTPKCEKCWEEADHTSFRSYISSWNAYCHK